MHELSITRSIVEACSERARGARVLRVTLEVGTLSCIMPDALRFCFDVCTRGTPLDGSRLEIFSVPGRARCRECGAELELKSLLDACPCGAFDLDVRQDGEGLIIKSMEVV